MFKRFAHITLALSLIVSTIALGWVPAKADISSCSSSVTPHSVEPDSTTDFSFQLTNTDPNPIHWIRITRPSSNFTITANSAPGWQSTTSSRFAFQTNGTLNSGQTLTITVTASAGSTEIPSENWKVEASEDPGVNIVSCTGSLGTAIAGFVPDTAPPQISNISVSSLSSSSATISWTTDEPSTSQVNYGFSSGYGQSSPLNSNLTTNHSVTLTGLSESSGYHFQVRSLDDSGNPGASSDNTFLTLADGAVSSGGGNTGGNSGIESPPKTKIPLKIQPSENVPPVVTLTTSFDKSFSSTPKISGKATDNDVLAGIEYSVDGGQNWLPVDSEQGLGSSKATFDFTPLNLEDGNYQVLARAIDTSSNIGYSAVHVLVVDRLPPIAGASVLSLGPQVMNPDENGVIYSLAGIDQKLTLSAVGGPTDMKILAKTSKGKVLESFTLTQMPDTGLWSGLVSFKKPGAYRLVVEALDGAGNKTSRVLNYVYAAPQPQTTYSTTGEPVNAQIEVYYLEPESRSWNLWEGASYGQDNPQNTDPLGNFKLFLPQGKYYIKASAKGYKQLTSDIFEIDHAKPFSATLGMEKNYTLDIGRFELSLPIWNTSKINTDFDNLLPANFGQSTLVDKQLPDFSLKDSKGQQIGPISFLGRPTLLSVMTTWSPDASRQIEALAALQTNGDINIVPIALQEKTGKTTSFTAISGQELSWLVDPDSTFSSVLKSGSVPTHYFVDRRGEVKAVLYGFLDKQTIQAHLGGL